MLENGKFLGERRKYSKVRGWESWRKVVISNSGISFIGEVTFEQRSEEGEAIGQMHIWGKRE